MLSSFRQTTKVVARCSRHGALIEQMQFRGSRIGFVHRCTEGRLKDEKLGLEPGRQIEPLSLTQLLLPLSDCDDQLA